MSVYVYLSLNCELRNFYRIMYNMLSENLFRFHIAPLGYPARLKTSSSSKSFAQWCDDWMMKLRFPFPLVSKNPRSFPTKLTYNNFHHLHWKADLHGKLPLVWNSELRLVDSILPTQCLKIRRVLSLFIKKPPSFEFQNSEKKLISVEPWQNQDQLKNCLEFRLILTLLLISIFFLYASN